ASVAHHPLPVEGGSDEAVGFAAIPRQRSESSHFFERESDVAAVADDMHEQGVRDVLFYALAVQNIIGVVNRPAANVLLLCDRVHHDTNEISASLALVQNAVRELLRRQSGAPETLAAQPCGHDFFPIGAALHRAITWDQNLVDRQVAAIDGKASRGQ